MTYVTELIKSFINDSMFTNDAFGVNFTEMAIQIVSTLLLFLVVRFFFWNHVTAYLEGRKAAMAKEYEDAKEANVQVQEIKLASETELNQIRLSAKDVIEDAKARGEKERTEIVVKAKKEANVVLENARKEIDSEIEKARSELNDEIVSVAVLMAEKVIKREIDEKKHQDLVQEVTKEVMN